MTDPVTRIDTGIYQVKLPLPFALKSVNAYLLADGDSWCIVDTGLNLPATHAAWEEAFSQLGIGPERISRILLTHCHPDHVGMAGTLQRRVKQVRSDGRPTVLASRVEIDFARAVLEPSVGIRPVLKQYFADCSVPGGVTDSVIESIERLQLATRPHPENVVYIQEGDVLEIGDRTFDTLHTPGHSDGHLIFFERTTGLALSGDHVLMRITPNISFWPPSAPDPLGRYLESLTRLQDLPVRIALPGHGPLIRDWSGRIAELRAHHDERLEAMQRSVEEGHTSPYEVCREVFDMNTLTPHEIRFAVAETLAHLEYLAGAGRVRRTGTIYRYTGSKI